MQNLSQEALFDSLPDSLIAYSADHEVVEEYLALQVTLTAALKTVHKKPAEDCAVKEVKSIIGHRVWSYRDTSIHPAVLSCQMLVKDKYDSRGTFLLWKGTLAVGGH